MSTIELLEALRLQEEADVKTKKETSERVSDVRGLGSDAGHSYDSRSELGRQVANNAARLGVSELSRDWKDWE